MFTVLLSKARVSARHQLGFVFVKVARLAHAIAIKGHQLGLLNHRATLGTLGVSSRLQRRGFNLVFGARNKRR